MKNSEYKKILVRMPNWLGDAVMATPVLAEVRRAWPDASITVMCQKAIGTLLIGNPHVDEIFIFSKPNEFLRRQEGRHLVERLRQGKYDLGILLTNSLSSAWWLWRGHVKRRIGFKNDCRSFLLTDPIAFPAERGKEHLVETYKRLLEPLGVKKSDSSPELFVTEEERGAALQILKQQKVPKEAKIVGINPTAAFGPAKCWLPERFRAVIEKLIKDPSVYVLCFGDQSRKETVHQICEGLPPQVINLSGATSIREFIALIQQCQVFLTNDSGPMHIAAALKVPLVALFGSTSPVATGPYKHGTVIQKKVACAPCFKRVCPIDFRCMKKIESDEVYDAVKSLLG